MSKRIIALLLCAVMLLPCLVGCQTGSSDEEDLGAYITMYLTENIYDFDPANAYYNQDTLNVVSLLYDTLFTLNSSGKVEKSLVKKYTIKENQEKNEYTMELKLRETWWSNRVRLSADDVVYAWKRLLNSNNSFSAASLLYDVKNARAVKEGDTSIDNIGVEAVEIDVVKISFEGPIDYDQFLLNLTSVATAPLLENYVEKNTDWAKKPSSMVTSGAYKLGKIRYVEVLDSKGNPETTSDDNAIDRNGNQNVKTDNELRQLDYFYLERNVNYYRDSTDDDVKIDSKVKNYRILVNCSMTAEEILKAYQGEKTTDENGNSYYKDGKLFYVGSVPLSLRNDEYVAKNVKITNALSTFVCYLNQNAMISERGNDDGRAIFADAKVRQALSLAIDREAIANEIVYGTAATGLICPGIFNEGKISKQDFRTVAGDLLSTGAEIDKAKELLSEANISPAKFSFSIKVASYDEENLRIAEMIAEQWTENLGFNVSVEPVTPIQNNDSLKELPAASDVPKDVCDDLFIEAIQRGKYEVIAFDYNAYSADAYSMLANFALAFSGQALEADTYALTPNVTGYNSEAYNNLMEAIYYIPYFANLTADSSDFLGIYDTVEEYQAVYNAVAQIYADNGITPSTKKSDWASQKATLLRLAEKMLVEDAPVIPVLFNQNATLTDSDLSKVSSNYYVPALFQNTKLKNYKDYFYLDKNGDSVSIFAEFPIVKWDAKDEVQEKDTTAVTTGE